MMRDAVGASTRSIGNVDEPKRGDRLWPSVFENLEVVNREVGHGIVRRVDDKRVELDRVHIGPEDRRID